MAKAIIAATDYTTEDRTRTATVYTIRARLIDSPYATSSTTYKARLTLLGAFDDATAALNEAISDAIKIIKLY